MDGTADINSVITVWASLLPVLIAAGWWLVAQRRRKGRAAPPPLKHLIPGNDGDQPVASSPKHIAATDMKVKMRGPRAYK